MNYKIQSAFRKNKKALIFSAILWVVLIIFLVIPLAFSLYAVSLKDTFDMTLFFNTFSTAMGQPFTAVGKLIERNAVGNILTIGIGFSLFYWIFFIIGFAKSAPKHEYSDIEHGSSDWSRHGEQYQILKKDKGIILAENNYLPVDKRGNVNVLVVGRIRIW